MTYVNKKTRVFMDRGDFKPERRRSEARLKTYPSAVDLRAWCDFVEDRRQHILELVQKGSEKCKPNIIPIQAIIDALMAEKEQEINKLKNLLAQQATEPEAVRSSKIRPKHHPGECPAKERHEAEKAEVDKIIEMPHSYKVKAQGPVKIKTKITGIKSGFKITPGPGNIATRATVRKVYPAQQPSSKNPVQGKSNADQGQPDAAPGPSNAIPGPSKAAVQGPSNAVQGQSKNAVQRPSNAAQAVTKPMQAAASKAAANRAPKSENPVAGQSPRSPNEPESIPPKAVKVKKEQKSERLGLSQDNPESRVETQDNPEESKVGQQDNVELKLGSEIKVSDMKADKITSDSFNAHQRPQEEHTTKIHELEDQLAARDAFCDEQQSIIKNLQKEKETADNQLQNCLKELEKLKKSQGMAGEPLVPQSCKEEIEALEHEMQVMRKGNPSPEQEAEFIKKEIDVLKRYCLKLEQAEGENEKLKAERDELKNQIAIPAKDAPDADKDGGDTAAITKERDALANRVQKLEKELLQYQDLPEDIDVYKDRSIMLDNALAERDELRKQLEQMQKSLEEVDELRRKADRVAELEAMLNRINKNGKISNHELQRTISKCCCLEKDLQNVKSEKDAMCKRIDCMQRELDQLRARAKECEMVKLERDRLQIKLNELSHVQAENESMMLKCKCLERSAGERDMYKQKYEEILSMECQCEVLRAGAEETNRLARDREALLKQVGDLESCIHEQEDEIKKLMCQIDCLMKNKDETQARMKDALCCMRAEVEKKDSIIAASEEKLVAVQAQLKSSIQGVSCETTCYKTRIEELERQLSHAQQEVQYMQKQLADRDNGSVGRGTRNKREMDAVAIMRKELEAARAENRKLQDIANKMRSITGDEHVQRMLRQSECAVRRVVEELGKQYREWDSMRQRSSPQQRSILSSTSKLNKTCACNVQKFEQNFSDSDNDNDKLKEELEDIQREKMKLENLVRQIQNDKDVEGGPQKEILNLRLENAKLQESLQREIAARQALERRIMK